MHTMDRIVVLLLVCLSGVTVCASDRNVSTASRADIRTGPSHDRVVVCYIASWAIYRPGRGVFTLDDIDPSLCSHLVYAFAGLNISSNTIRSLDPYNDLEEDYGKGMYKKMTAMRIRYPHLKVTLAIGGWNEGSTNYSILAASPDRRQAFIRSVTEFIRKYNFDGLDLDWEFPGNRGGAADDKDNFVLLVKELRAAFDKHGWLLTAALGAGLKTMEIAYDVPALGQYLDFLHIMCYDYHGTWDKQTGANTPFRSQPDQLSVEDTIEYLIRMGAPRHKLVLGLSMYGRTFLMTEAANINTDVLGAKAGDKGFQGPFTREDGFLGYNEICLLFGVENSGWKQYWDEKSSTPYAVKENQVISYDNAQSITEKVKYAVENNMAGLMVWAMDNDDFQGDCDTRNNKKYPLMITLNRAVVQALEDKQNRVIEEEERDKLYSSAAAVLPTLCQVIAVAAVMILGQ